MNGLGGLNINSENTADTVKKAFNATTNQVKQQVNQTAKGVVQQIGLPVRDAGTSFLEKNMQSSTPSDPSELFEQNALQQQKSQTANASSQQSIPTNQRPNEEQVKIAAIQKELKSLVNEDFERKPKEILQTREKQYQEREQEQHQEQQQTEEIKKQKEREFESIILKNRKTGGGEIGKAKG